MLNRRTGNQRIVASATEVKLKESRTPLMMQVEPRIMFDGAMAVAVADAVHATDTHAAADPAHATAEGTTPDVAPAAVPAPAADTGRHDVLFVDARVVNADQLLQGAAPGTEIVYLSAQQDGLEQIANYLDQHQGASSVQIIAHGNAGELWLGNSYLSADNVQAYHAVLAEIGTAMDVGGDILIYGCYTAEGERGSSFVDSLAQLTGRDVAASNDRSGVGGDWDLEIATGNIESTNVLSATAMSEYEWGLATWTATTNANTGIGSLRAAIASAQNGDIVTFNGSMTVQLTSELLIDKNITVDGDLNNDGAADVILDGQYRTRVVEVTAGSTVTLEGLVITRGLVSGTGGNSGYGATGAMAGGIFNAGTLTLNNVTVTSNAASGGGGGGGGGSGSNASNGGIGGRGVGAIWNKGTLLITAANFSALSGNAAASGAGGVALGGGSTGTSPTSVATIYNDGGVLNTAYAPPPTATIVVGSPRIAVTLDNGGTVHADYLSGSGSSALTFRATVVTGQLDVTGIGLGTALDLDGATVRDVSGNDAVVTLNNVASTAGVRVDAVAPGAALTQTGSPRADVDTLTFQLTTSEDVSGVDTGDFTLLNTGSVTAVISGVESVDARTYLITVSNVQGAGTLALTFAAAGSGIADTAGNALLGDLTTGVHTVDTLAPPIQTDAVAPPAAATEQTTQTPITPYILLPTAATDGGQAGFTNTFGAPTIAGILVDSSGSPGNSFGGPFSDAPGDAGGDRGSNPIAPVAASYVANEPQSGGAPLQALADLGVHTLRSNDFFSVALPAGTFSVADRNSVQIVLEVRQANGRPLPSWLNFDARTGTLFGRPPPAWSGKLDIQITAGDGKGNHATSVIHFDVKAMRPAAGRAALDAQFKSARHADAQVDAQLLRHLNAAARKQAPSASIH